MPSILILDDSAEAGPLLEEALAEYAPVRVSFREGADLSEEGGPDLVILCLGFRDRDGLELCRGIKKRGGKKYLPVIIVSESDDPGARIRSLEAGAADFLGPPLDPGEVAARIGNQLEIHRLNRKLRLSNQKLASALARIRRQNSRLKVELEAAAAVQRALLPGPAAHIPNLNLEWRLSPSTSVAGDLLDWYVLDESRVGFYLADVSGHGAASGLLAASIHQALTPRSDRSCLVRTLPGGEGYWRPTPPEEVARELERIFPYQRFEKYFTMVYGVLNHRTGRLAYLTAGHPRPVLIRSRGGLRELETTGPPVGLEAGGFDPGETFLEPGDRLFVYSDGITEAEGENGFYGRERLFKILERGREKALDDFLNSVLEGLKAFRGKTEQRDDVACLALEMGREQLRLF